MQFFIKLSNNQDKTNIFKLDLNSLAISESNNKTTFEILNVFIENKFKISSNDFTISSNSGVLIKPNYSFQNGQTLQISPKVLGGKGGFGSLLRAFGKQITRSTDKGACRDLTGRRIRHVDNEKKLKEFLGNQSELKRQKEQEKVEKEERRKKKRDKIEAKHHLFVDPKYDEQKQKIANDLDEAILKGIDNRKDFEKGANESESKTDDNEPMCSKTIVKETIIETKTSIKIVEVKRKETSKVLKDWMGVGDLEVSSSSDDDEEEDVPAKKAKRN